MDQHLAHLMLNEVWGVFFLNTLKKFVSTLKKIYEKLIHTMLIYSLFVSDFRTVAV